MIWRIGIDTGGTFTDVVAMNLGTGALVHLKVHSTPQDPGDAVCRALEALRDQYGVDFADIGAVIHGSTVATNAVLERKGAKTAFLTTEGFRDVLLIQRQSRLRLYDLSCRRADPVIPRSAIFEVTERTLADGGIHIPLDEAQAEEAISRIAEGGYEAVSVGFLHSTINPGHERRIGEMLRARLPACAISLSHEIVGSQGEYERFNTALVNGYVQPRMQGYLENLQQRLSALRAGGLFIMKSNGGMTTPEVAGARSVETLLSGPAGGVIAGQGLARGNHPHLITADVGGTSFDVAVIHDGIISYSDKSDIGGLAVNLPMIDIHTVGAGGGSIGWIDAGGALRVGPYSAGADPGPACYGRGGTQPTVTDANLVLGRIARQSSLAGGMQLDEAAARAAIKEHLSSRLGMSVEEAAEGMIRIVNARMTGAIRKLTVERGHDPRDFALCMFGGTGPLHGAELAEEMGLQEVIIPLMPGVFSAFGLLISEMREEQMQACLRPLDNTEESELEARLAELARIAADRLDFFATDSEGYETARRIQLRYQGQSHVITVELPGGSLCRNRIRRQFEKEHEQLFGYLFPGDPIEIVNLWAVVSRSENRKPPTAYKASGDTARTGARRCCFGGEFIETAVYDRFALAPGTVFRGPAVLEQTDTTTLVLPGQEIIVDSAGNLILRSRNHRPN